MKDLLIKAVVTSPDGFYHRQENEWRGMNTAEAGPYFTKVLNDSAALAKSLAGKKGGNMTATLSAVIDGTPQPDVVVTGFSRDALTKFQRHAHKVSGDLIAEGEKLAAAK